MKLTYKQKFNKKYGFPKDKAHSLRDIARITGRSYKGIKQIFEKGEGAYYSNPASVRKNVKSPQQWAYARVYSAVMGGKAAKVDKKELGTKKKSKMQRKSYKTKSYSKTLKFNGKIYKLDTKPLLTGFGQSRSANAKKRKTELNKSGYNVRIVKRKTIDGTNRILVYKRKK
tara:strand:+ start:45 stop:557 length:513 start_codon:yes stop_codon:yes gene_type:complete